MRMASVSKIQAEVAGGIADHSGEEIVVSRIEVVENDFGQRVLLREAAEIRAERLGPWPVSDGVEADIAPQLAQHGRVDVAVGAEMKLLGPVLLRIEATK